MQKSYFHKNRSTDGNKEQKISTLESNMNTKNIVDINILLNRVKLEEKNETKKKILFFSFIVLAITLFGTFITIIK